MIQKDEIRIAKAKSEKNWALIKIKIKFCIFYPFFTYRNINKNSENSRKLLFFSLHSVMTNYYLKFITSEFTNDYNCNSLISLWLIKL